MNIWKWIANIVTISYLGFFVTSAWKLANPPGSRVLVMPEFDGQVLSDTSVESRVPNAFMRLGDFDEIVRDSRGKGGILTYGVTAPGGVFESIVFQVWVQDQKNEPKFHHGYKIVEKPKDWGLMYRIKSLELVNGKLIILPMFNQGWILAFVIVSFFTLLSIYFLRDLAWSGWW